MLVVEELEAGDLDSMQITLPGHRKALLLAAKKLKQGETNIFAEDAKVPKKPQADTHKIEEGVKEDDEKARKEEEDLRIEQEREADAQRKKKLEEEEQHKRKLEEEEQNKKKAEEQKLAEEKREAARLAQKEARRKSAEAKHKEAQAKKEEEERKKNQAEEQKKTRDRLMRETLAKEKEKETESFSLLSSVKKVFGLPERYLPHLALVP